MEHEDPLTGAPIREDELDARLAALFQSVASPAPTAGFAARTMRAVQRAPLPAGRKPLRSPLTSLLAWAAVVAVVAMSAWSIVSTQPVFAASFTALITKGVGIGIWLTQFSGTGLALLNVLATMGLAISRAAVTMEGATGLVLVAVIGGVSLSFLHRLLSEGEGSSWQELS